jgi:hypothetical protein
VNRETYSEPQVDSLVSVLATAGLNLTPDVLLVTKKRLEALLFRRPGWWRAWQFAAMSGRELRDALLQHAQLTIESATKRKIAFDQFAALEKEFEVVLFGTRLIGDEPNEELRPMERQL